MGIMMIIGIMRGAVMGRGGGEINYEERFKRNVLHDEISKNHEDNLITATPGLGERESQILNDKHP